MTTTISLYEQGASTLPAGPMLVTPLPAEEAALVDSDVPEAAAPALSPSTQFASPEALLRAQPLSALLDALPGTLYRAANAGFPDAIGPWRIIYVSGQCAALTGFRPDELVDDRVALYHDLIDSRDRARVLEELRSALHAGQPLRTSYRLRDRSGDRRWVWEQARGVYDAAGRVVGVDGFLADVTERRAQEQAREVESREAGVRLTARTFEHELRNRLAVTAGYAELLERTPQLPENARRRASLAASAAHDAARIIHDLIEAAFNGEIDWGTPHGTTLDVGSVRDEHVRGETSPPAPLP
ncbi:MAG: hypothetical protein AVDCRST_MAG77-4254 [uncultured Chloroflexi bacterium]|uniref:histidine kinase n=1 Tax=uncultured Chloroflexota bacterium TaxID=166587 RepID=A0A6J4JRE2_9CHLR|nr:MAG: hypothetical protein AVDCRST_MAG77-4254 [uncultured Chloroflexota bacterium]